MQIRSIFHAPYEINDWSLKFNCRIWTYICEQFYNKTVKHYSNSKITISMLEWDNVRHNSVNFWPKLPKFWHNVSCIVGGIWWRVRAFGNTFPRHFFGRSECCLNPCSVLNIFLLYQRTDLKFMRKISLPFTYFVVSCYVAWIFSLLH